MGIESFSATPLADIIPAYVYQEYADDENVQAFFTAYNEIAQGYHNWFLNTPMGVYTNPAIVGTLLDLVGNGLYGISRPVISTLSSSTFGQYISVPYMSTAYGGFVKTESGTSVIASDDYYKRTLTWILYKGDGMQMSLPWFKKRVARFLYGANGSDIDVSDIYNVGLQNSSQTVRTQGAYDTYAYNTFLMNGSIGPIPHRLVITIPQIPASSIFSILLGEGFLPAPFQMSYEVVIA